MLDIWMRSIARAGGVEVPYDRPILAPQRKRQRMSATTERQRNRATSGILARMVEALQPVRLLRPRGCDGV